ncbi:MAG: hypothetical protein AAGJ81_14180 [Verrucomicrobiota bacterium]
MKLLIHRASYGGTKHYTRDMLFSEWLRREVTTLEDKFIPCVVFGLVGAVVLSIFFSDAIPSDMRILVGIGILGAVFALSYWVLSLRRPNRKKVDLSDALDKWIDAGRGNELLLDKPSLHSLPPDWPEPDIYDYGAEKILIVNRDILVDLFVMNSFHAEGSALVVSSSGYPGYIAHQAERLVIENPEIPVLFLHDANWSFERMKSESTDSMPFLAGATQMVDVGIGPETLLMLPGIKKAVSREVAAVASVDMIPYMALVYGVNLSAEQGLPLETIIANPKKYNESSLETSFG